MDHYHRGGNLFSLVLCMILHAVYTEHVISICWLLTRGKNWCCVKHRGDIRDILFVGFETKSSKEYMKAIEGFISNIRAGKSMEEASKILAQNIKF